MDKKTRQSLNKMEWDITNRNITCGSIEGVERGNPGCGRSATIFRKEPHAVDVMRSAHLHGISTRWIGEL